MGFRLSYLGVEASDLDAWQRFADLVGFQSARERDGLILRTDERARRIVVAPGAADDVTRVGWEVDSAAEFDASVKRLQGGGVAVAEGTPAEAEVRAVERFVKFADPAGTPMELALGAKTAGTPFQSAEIKHGFLTGNLGLGHIVIPTTDHEAGAAFCRKYLNGMLSDTIVVPMPQGAFQASFLHMNPRHHSVAYVQAPIPRTKRIHHFMVQCNEIEDVGRAYERLIAAGTNFGMKLGQHTNDKNVSFYAQTPSGFFMEMGAGGILVDDATWVPTTLNATSFWGHERPAAH
jgi:2,3-dihydroxybiphenyl 1,2-dioxygenase